MRYSCFVFLILSAISLQSYSQAELNQSGYYVVVGAFSIKKNAEKHTQRIKESGFECAYAFVESRGLYYVYTSFGNDITTSKAEAAKLRLQPEFGDSWVYVLNGEEYDSLEIGDPPQEVIQVSLPIANDTLSNIDLSERKQSGDVNSFQGQDVFLSLYNSRNDKVVNGTVSIVNTEGGRLMNQIAGNTYTYLPDPKTPSRKITLVCDALGYRKIQHDVIFNNLLNDSTSSFVEDIGIALMINFELVQYVKGDKRTLYNVYFYNDAAIMLPVSKYELTQLKNMMIENPKYRIVLHGHTNGNYHGKILTKTKDGDLFTFSKNAPSQLGTAKKLSLMRAGVVRDYLIKEGVEGSRVEVKSWGGKRPLYDRHSVNAKRNVRVEVEIIEN